MRRWFLRLAIPIALLAVLAWFGRSLLFDLEPPIRVGILHSKTGSMAISEKSMIDAELLAIEELNASGGLLGRRVVAVEADGRSDPQIFAQEARRLIEAEKVSVIFGCWTSLSRRSVRKVVDEANLLLFFPSNYEGMDQPANIVCTGPIPNQQVIPAVNWCFETLKARKYFLAGSSDIQSFSSNALIRDQLTAMGASLAGEKYIAVDGKGVAEVVAAIKASAPDVVLSTVAGDANKEFYQELSRAGLTPERLPVVSFTIGEDELRDLPLKEMVGDYAAWSYFQSIDSEKNREFVRRFKARFGADRVTSDAIVAAYNAVKLWAQAVAESDTPDPSTVRKAIGRQTLEAPEGVVSVDQDNLHTWRPFYVGKIEASGQFQIVWSLEKPVRPVPFPALRTRAEWSSFVERLYTTWGTREFNPQSHLGPQESVPALAVRRPGRIAPEVAPPVARRPRTYQR